MDLLDYLVVKTLEPLSWNPFKSPGEICFNYRTGLKETQKKERGHLPGFVPAPVNVSPETDFLKVVCSVPLHQIVPSTLGGIVTQFYQRNGNKYQIASQVLLHK